LKNEVKKKMHGEWRAMLYQSHNKMHLDRKIPGRLRRKASQACNSKRHHRRQDFFRAAHEWRGLEPMHLRTAAHLQSFSRSAASIMNMRNLRGSMINGGF
jgi:hypothetical protein